MLSGSFRSSRYPYARDVHWRLAVLAYLYPPGRTADDRWWVRWEAAKVIRRAVRAAS